MKTIESIALFFKEGSSDKQYNVVLSQDDDGTYSVDAFYGRRGAALKPAPQGKGFTLTQAEQIYAKTINGKTRKGYQGNGQTSGAVSGIVERNDTGLRASLLTPLTSAEAPGYIEDDRFGMQEKFDGERLLVSKNTAGNLTFANRNGLATSVAEEVAADIRNWTESSSWTIDGELVKNVFFAFDLLSLDNFDLSGMPYSFRYDELLRVRKTSKSLMIADLWTEKEIKAHMYDELRARKAEGVVFKRLTAGHTVGRGTDQIKIKFWKSASFIVAAHNAKRSVALHLLDEHGNLIDVGNVTVKANQQIPPIGSIIEIKYLYAYQGGSVYQPELLHVRTDIPREECLMTQLEYKGES